MEIKLMDFFKQSFPAGAFLAIGEFYDFFPGEGALSDTFWNIAAMLQESESFQQLDATERANIIHMLKMISSFSSSVFMLIGEDIQQELNSSL